MVKNNNISIYLKIKKQNFKINTKKKYELEIKQNVKVKTSIQNRGSMTLKVSLWKE